MAMEVRSVCIAGKSTSMRLEPAMWRALEAVARRERVSINDLLTHVRRCHRDEGSSLASAVRVYLLEYFRSAADAGAVDGPDPRGPKGRRPRSG